MPKVSTQEQAVENTRQQSRNAFYFFIAQDEDGNIYLNRDKEGLKKELGAKKKLFVVKEPYKNSTPE